MSDRSSENQVITPGGLTGSSTAGFSYESTFQNIAELLWCNETLEAYNVVTCGDYPAGSTALGAIYIGTGGSTPALNWTTVNRVTDCGQNAVATNDNPGGSVTITY